MVFSSFFNLILTIFFIVLGALFAAGLVLLIVGIVKKKKPDSKGKKSPAVMIVFGILLIVPAVIVLSLVLFFKTGSVIKENTWKSKYDSVAEMWKDRRVNEDKACEQAFDELTKAADAGDKEAFSKQFSETVRQRPDFQEKLDAFFESYPGNLAGLEYDDHLADSSQSLHHGHNVKTANNSLDAHTGRESYYISLECCYENTDNPEEVGVTEFHVFNLEGWADYGYDSFGNVEFPDDDEYLLCYIRTSEDITARCIKSKAYPWTPSDKEPITKDKMKELLVNNDYFDDAKREGDLGEPNVTYHITASTADMYIYELASENGKPLYVNITVNAEGRIVDAITYGELQSDGHEWLVNNTPKFKEEKKQHKQDTTEDDN